MNKTNFIPAIVMLLIMACCKAPNTKVIEEANKHVGKKPLMNDTLEKPIYALIRKAMTTGDTIAYADASYQYFHEENEAEFLNVALIMANKYDFSDAYYEVYIILAHPNTGESLDGLDHDTKCIALYYLLKAREKGNTGATDECKTIFKGQKIPKPDFYLLEMAKK